MHVKNIFNLQYDYKFISSGGCTSVLPDDGSLSVGVPLFVLSSAVLPDVSVFVLSVSLFSFYISVLVFLVLLFMFSVPVFVFSSFFLLFSLSVLSVLLSSPPMFFCSKRSGNVPPFPAISLRRASNASFVLI